MPATVDRYRGVHLEYASMKYVEGVEVELDAIAKAAAATTASAVVFPSPDMGGVWAERIRIWDAVRIRTNIQKIYTDI